MNNDLHSRVKELKHISLEIETELEHQKNLMREMDGNFGSSSSILSSAMNKVKHLINTQNGSWVWIMLLFIIAVITYLIFK